MVLVVSRGLKKALHHLNARIEDLIPGAFLSTTDASIPTWCSNYGQTPRKNSSDLHLIGAKQSANLAAASSAWYRVDLPRSEREE